MTIVTEKAPAKLNLTLDVLSKRPDGYHDLQSVMQTVSLCDEITLQIGTGKPWEVRCDTEGVPCDSRNLVWKAAEVFFEALGENPAGLDIHILKRIPSQAGMGGGSADAAAVFRALNRHYGEPYAPLELAELGARVGSDVPFCVIGGTVMCEGRGERMRPLDAMPGCQIVIIKPDFPVSTPALFRAIDSEEISIRPDNASMEQAIAAGDLKRISGLMCNVFEPVVSKDHPEIRRFRSIAMACGALGCQMTGSGSACFALLDSREKAEKLADVLKAEFSSVFLAEPV